MSRPKGSKNKVNSALVETFSYSTEQRLELVANLIVEQITLDLRNGRNLLALIEDTYGTK